MDKKKKKKKGKYKVFLFVRILISLLWPSWNPQAPALVGKVVQVVLFWAGTAFALGVQSLLVLPCLSDLLKLSTVEFESYRRSLRLFSLSVRLAIY